MSPRPPFLLLLALFLLAPRPTVAPPPHPAFFEPPQPASHPPRARLSSAALAEFAHVALHLHRRPASVPETKRVSHRVAARASAAQRRPARLRRAPPSPVRARVAAYLRRAASARAVARQIVSRGGLTLDKCVRKEDCKGSRWCKERSKLLTGEEEFCATGEDCVCSPREVPAQCSSRADCVKGEVCAALTAVDGKPQICISRNTAESGDVEVQVTKDPTPLPATSDGAGSGNTGGDDDDEDDDSEGGNDNDGDSDSNGDDDTSSGGGDDSDTDGNGEDDDMTGDGSDSPTGTMPESSDEGDTTGDSDENTDTESGATAEPLPSATLEDAEDDEICIDARALSHLSKKDLVFKNHKWANVLCDDMGSCATAGHMVNFNGRAMRMKTYCILVKCVERVMQVNSPRYSRGLQVDSSTEGLRFHAFAARYNTRVEEAVLAFAVRAGL